MTDAATVERIVGAIEARHIVYLEWVAGDRSGAAPTVAGEMDRQPQLDMFRAGVIAFDEHDMLFDNPFLTPRGKAVVKALRARGAMR